MRAHLAALTVAALLLLSATPAAGRHDVIVYGRYLSTDRHLSFELAARGCGDGVDYCIYSGHFRYPRRFVSSYFGRLEFPGIGHNVTIDLGHGLGHITLRWTGKTGGVGRGVVEGEDVPRFHFGSLTPALTLGTWSDPLKIAQIWVIRCYSQLHESPRAGYCIAQFKLHLPGLSATGLEIRGFIGGHETWTPTIDGHRYRIHLVFHTSLRANVTAVRIDAHGHAVGSVREYHLEWAHGNRP